MPEREVPIWLATRLALRPAEAAAALGVSPRTLRNLRLPVVRDGGLVLYPVDQLREWLQARAAEEPGRVDEAVEKILTELG